MISLYTEEAFDNLEWPFIDSTEDEMWFEYKA